MHNPSIPVGVQLFRMATTVIAMFAIANEYTAHGVYCSQCWQLP